MEMTLRIAAVDRREVADIIERLMGCVLLEKELPSVQYVIGGFYFRSERSPMMLLAALEEEGFHFVDFESISFQH